MRFTDPNSRIDSSAFRACGCALLLLFLPPMAAHVHGQQPDSVRPVELAPVIVAAERARVPLAASTAAAARLSRGQLQAAPLRSVAEALQAVPGVTFLDVDGLGLDPQLTLRGFYGGGEAEYVVVLLDGRPLNGLESGLFDWDLVPLSALESIEVVRGGASSLYGDAAVGGVINLVSAAGERRGSTARLAGGSHGVLRGSRDLATDWTGRPLTVFANFQRADGFRDHAGRTAGSARATLGLARGAQGELSLSTLHHWRVYDEPGPLTAAELAVSRTGAHPFYRFDAGNERLHRLSLDGRRLFGGRAELSGYLTGELRALEAVRTLPLAIDFADTKERVLHTGRLLGSAQVRIGDGALPAAGALLLGADWSAGRLDNEHYGVVAGPADAYRGASSARGALDARGHGSRVAAAGFARYELRPRDALRLTAGARLDWLRDAFEAERPEPREAKENTHLAFSPQAGANLRWLHTERQEGHVFLNAGRSFKAPTPDQLFDQRSIPVPFEPYRLTLSNPDLEPARGTSIEAGLYHRASLVPSSLDASLSLAAYQLDMADELDIDLQSYRYVNIGRSRHRGLEAGLEVTAAGGPAAYASYTLQAVTFRNGEYRGNALKAIPRHAFAAGVRAGGSRGPAGSLGVHGARGIQLDDANTIELPGWTRCDARLSHGWRGLRLDVEVFNLLDREYSTTGYPDPAGSGTVFYYPAAGRVLQLGVTASW